MSNRVFSVSVIGILSPTGWKLLHSLAMSSSSPLIASHAALEDLRGRLDGVSAIGIDTEFLRERTYRAELCLLQLTTPQGPVCVDPLALGELELLRGLLGGEGPLKVLHAARQDLEVLAPLVGAVRPLFDTQVAAALAGHPAQVGYAELVRRLLERELPKAHTRTDWSRRPLSPEQVDYALDDVRYLLPLQERLSADIEALGRTAWLAEELAALEAPAGLGVDPELAWQRFKGVENWDAGRLALLRALAAWRERRAIAKNRPRGWILDDSVLRELVQRVPRDRAELGSINEMPEGVVKHSGDELLAMIEGVGISDPPPPLPRRERPDPQFVALVKRLTEVVQTSGRELNLAPEVLATRRDLEEIARGTEPEVVLQGWRVGVLADRLRAAA
ncbi:MAG: ribonuclease D [Sinobacteraceae bacterium]|nr:ribonuclease D [Nevskiaceae bacterium]